MACSGGRVGSGGCWLCVCPPQVGGWFLRCTWNAARAPFVRVAFEDVFVADQLTSMVIFIRDFFFAACFVGQVFCSGSRGGGAQF